MLIAGAAVLLAFVASAGAATIAKKNSTGNLNSKQSWIGNKMPNSTDIALRDSTVTGALANSLGGNLTWLGIRITNPGGPITINAGSTLTLGSSGIDMSSATANFNLNCAVALAAAQTWSVNSGRTLTAAGVISGSSSLTKSGAGTLTPAGTNTFTGGVTVNGGTLSTSSAAALGSGTSSLTLNPTGIFQTTATFSTSRSLILGGTGGAASGGTIDVAAGTTHTRTGVISGSGSLTKTGSGTLTLSGTNTFTGDTYINGGTLSVSGGQSLGPQPSAGSSLYAIHMANGTTFQSTAGFSAGYRQ
ncbi:MAG TPA: autotransporter-associated beta strand repeat-containing protein, partial [Chthoniobacterales bacterium]